MVDIQELIQLRIAADTYELIIAAKSATSLGSLNYIVGSVLAKLDFNRFAIFEIRHGLSELYLHPLFGEGFAEWTKHYNQMGYAQTDDFLQEATKAHQGFYWSELLHTRPLSPVAHGILADAHRHGLMGVFCVPLRDLDDTACYMGLFSGANVDVSNVCNQAIVSALATTYASVGFYVSSPHTHMARGGVPSLTPRQIECLTWVRAGKSSTDIASIIGISREVVNEHIGYACKRLGVRTRGQAILVAAEHGLLSLAS